MLKFLDEFIIDSLILAVLVFVVFVVYLTERFLNFIISEIKMLPFIAQIGVELFILFAIWSAIYFVWKNWDTLLSNVV